MYNRHWLVWLNAFSVVNTLEGNRQNSCSAFLTNQARLPPGKRQTPRNRQANIKIIHCKGKKRFFLFPPCCDNIGHVWVFMWVSKQNISLTTRLIAVKLSDIYRKSWSFNSRWLPLRLGKIVSFPKNENYQQLIFVILYLVPPDDDIFLCVMHSDYRACEPKAWSS